MENQNPPQPTLTLTTMTGLASSPLTPHHQPVELICTCCFLPVHWQLRQGSRVVGDSDLSSRWAFIAAPFGEDGQEAPCGGRCSVFDLVEVPA